MLRFLASFALVVAAPLSVPVSDAASRPDLITIPTRDDGILAPRPPAEVVAKFPGESEAEIGVLEYANVLVNFKIDYEDDMTQYGADDLWVMDPVSMKGDCEDYAITKYSALSRAGYPAMSHTRILTALVTEDGQQYGHAVLEVKMTNGTIAILDNRYNHLMTKEEVIADGYTLYDWS